MYCASRGSKYRREFFNDRYRNNGNGKKPGINLLETISAEELNEIANHKLLTHKEELELGSRIQSGEIGAIKELVSCNLKFVISLSKKFHNTRFPLPDCIGEGVLGLIEAARRYDPKRKLRFCTYAGYWIRRFLINGYVERKSSIIHVPKHNSYTEEKVMKGLVLSEGQVPCYEASLSAYREYSDVYELEEYLPWQAPRASEEEESLYEPEDYAMLKKALNSMKERDRIVICARYGLAPYDKAHTLAEVGKILKVTRERVRQIQRVAMEKLRAVVIELKTKNKEMSA